MVLLGPLLYCCQVESCLSHRNVSVQVEIRAAALQTAHAIVGRTRGFRKAILARGIAFYWPVVSSPVIFLLMLLSQVVDLPSMQKVEVYLVELYLCQHSDMDNLVMAQFSRMDTIGKRI